MSQVIWSAHAVRRALQRFPEVDVRGLYSGSKRPTRKQKRRILAKCPLSRGVMTGRFSGKYYTVHRSGVVFVNAVVDKTTVVVVTVFGLPEPV